MENRRDISIAGCGWLGEPLACRLVSKGCKVKGSGTRPEKLEHLRAGGIEPFLLRLEDLAGCPAEFFQSDTLIVLIPPRDPVLFRDLIRRIGSSPIRQVLLASSTSVYGPAVGSITEDAPLHPGPVGEIEAVFRNCSDFSTTVIRFGGLFGYDRHPGRWFAGRTLRDPEGVVNLIHREDCIGIIETILEKNIRGEVFNACAPVHPSRSGFYTRAAVSLGLDPPVIPAGTPSEVKEVSSARLIAALNYTFLHPDPLAAVLSGF